MELKKDEGANFVVAEKDGKLCPVYVDDKDGTDIVVDVPSLFAKVGTLNAEGATKRKTITELQAKLDKVKHIEDLDGFLTQASTALETVANLKDKQMIDAGEVEKLKKQIKDGYLDKEKGLLEKFATEMKLKETELSMKDQQIRKLIISSSFSSDPHFAGQERKTTLFPAAAEAYFGSQFKVEEINGELKAVGYVGDQKVLSKANPGEPAPFHEAVAIIINNHPLKNEFIRAGKTGSGSAGDGGGGTGEIATMEAQRQKALKDKDMATAMALKRKIHEKMQAR